MPSLDSFVLPLLIISLLFAITELGLSAYIVSVATTTIAVSTYDPNYAGLGYGGYDEYTTNVKSSAPGPVNFLLFASIWTMLLTPIFIALPFLSKRKGSFWNDNAGQPMGWLAPAALALNGTTMVFWLAGFAALASLLSGAAPQGIVGALLAFAVMLWLIFLALLFFNLLTAFGVVTSERIEYASVFKRRGSKKPLEISPVAPECAESG